MRDDTIWFTARRYGWGWGLPRAWQGWMAYGLYAAAIALAFGLLPPQAHPSAFIAWIAMASALMVAVCWAKGEKPRWRWGTR